jgi:hypothetical protein
MLQNASLMALLIEHKRMKIKKTDRAHSNMTNESQIIGSGPFNTMLTTFKNAMHPSAVLSGLNAISNDNDRKEIIAECQSAFDLSTTFNLLNRRKIYFLKRFIASDHQLDRGLCKTFIKNSKP